MDGACFGAARERAEANAHRHRDYSGAFADRTFLQHVARKTFGQSEIGPAPGRNTPRVRKRRVAGGGGSTCVAGDLWSAESTGNFSGPRRRGPYGCAEGFHRWLHLLVRADGQEWNSPGGLGGNQRRYWRGRRNRNVPHRRDGDWQLDRLRP